jgi:hypothetical protein
MLRSIYDLLQIVRTDRDKVRPGNSLSSSRRRLYKVTLRSSSWLGPLKLHQAACQPKFKFSCVRVAKSWMKCRAVRDALLKLMLPGMIIFIKALKFSTTPQVFTRSRTYNALIIQAPKAPRGRVA